MIAANLVSNVTIVTALILSAATLVAAIASLRAVHVASRESEYTKLAFSAQFLPYWTIDASNCSWTIWADDEGQEFYQFDIALKNSGKGTAYVPGSPIPILTTGTSHVDLDAHPLEQFTPIDGTMGFLASCSLDELVMDSLPVHGEFRFIYADEAQKLWRATEYQVSIYDAGRLDIRHRSTTGRPLEHMAGAAKVARLLLEATESRPPRRRVMKIGGLTIAIQWPLEFEVRPNSHP